MDTLEDMRKALQSDLTVSDTSSLFDSDTLDLAINRAYRKSGGLFLWPETEDAQKTSTVSGQEYYDFPQNWRPYSMFRLEIDGNQYGETPDGSPMSYPDFLIWKKENPSSIEKKWSIQWRRYFINPIPSANGSFNISAWGQKVVELLEDDGDVTIFSYALPECNEAVVLEAGAILKGKEDNDKGGEFKSTEAKGILGRAWSRINQEKAKLEKTQPFFYVPDFFKPTNPTRKSSNIGDF